MQKVVESSLPQAGCYPSTIACVELVFICVQHYHPDSRESQSANKFVIVRIDIDNVALALHILERDIKVNLSIQSRCEFF